MQVYRMFTIRLGLLRTLAVILAGHLVLAACDKSTPRDEAEVAAGRENVEAMSREHADDTTDPSPAATAGWRVVARVSRWPPAATMAPASPVVSDPRLPYAEAGNELVYGYFAAPSDVIEPAPALIVIHEWWGLNDNVRAMADRLAGEG